MKIKQMTTYKKSQRAPSYFFILAMLGSVCVPSFANLSHLPKKNTQKSTRSEDNKARSVSTQKKHATNNIGLRARAALVMDKATGKVLYEQKANEVLPIASITKLMMALVVVESKIKLDKKIRIADDDLRATMQLPSRLPKNSLLTREEMLRLALMSSENRAASALARTYPGGRARFIKQMNLRAKSLGMTRSRFIDATGLRNGNLSTSRDLVKLVIAAAKNPLIKKFSTLKSRTIRTGKYIIPYANSNKLVRDDSWNITLQKTGTTRKAGRCVIMLTKISGRPVIMVLLQSRGKLGRVKDAQRLRSWIELQSPVRGRQT